jgi:hypothetical protein
VLETTAAVAQEWTLNGTEESLCVTNDSKVGVGIANPQRSLEVAGDLVVGGTISGGAGMGMFRNRIINGDMRIAQRGTSFAGVFNTVIYGIDRWNFYMYNSGGTAGSLTVAQQTLTASDTPYQLGLGYSTRATVPIGWSSATGTGINALLQYIEGYTCADLQWGTSFGSPVTLSFWCRTNVSGRPNVNINLTNTGAPASYCNLFQAGDPGVWKYVTLTVQPPPNGSTPTSTTNGVWFGLGLGGYGTSQTGTAGTWGGSSNQVASGTSPIYANAGNYIEFTGVQLEKGTVATGFEFRPYATELALCQRYWEQSYAQGTAVGTSTGTGLVYVSGTSDNSLNLGAYVKYAVPKRVSVSPTLYTQAGTSGTVGYSKGTNINGSNTASIGYQSEFSFFGYCNIGATYTGGQILFHWTANAEL